MDYDIIDLALRIDIIIRTRLREAGSLNYIPGDYWASMWSYGWFCNDMVGEISEPTYAPLSYNYSPHAPHCRKVYLKIAKLVLDNNLRESY